MTNHIPDDHPRAVSLKMRYNIIDGMHSKVVAEAGLIAHGRGEAFDYLIGEVTNENAIKTMEAAVASIMTAKHPILSVNGNITALCPESLVQLSIITKAPLEINLFYAKPGRIEAITKVLKDAGATPDMILGTKDSKKTTIEELSSNRRFVDPNGIKKADVVFVPLEDGDRTEALIKEGKTVITIDLNPMSRTAQWAQVTIVDNVVRAIPKMVEIAKNFKENLDKNNITKIQIEKIAKNFDNKNNLSKSMKIMRDYLDEISKKGIFIKI